MKNLFPLLLLICLCSSALAQETLDPNVSAKELLSQLRAEYELTNLSTKGVRTQNASDCWGELEQIEVIIRETKRLHMKLYKNEGQRIQLVIDTRKLMQQLDRFRPSEQEWSGLCVASFGFMMLDLVDFLEKYPVNY